MRWMSAGECTISFCAIGSLAISEPGVLASETVPTYSEWSVTPIQSSGVSILMS
jgi:hypothetical protein